ncbi:Uncharacterized protein DAT39_004524 [Clarias magur]|uniref:Uncharacterized protein n=1 Tax=Clarias magur TaxID=1594786 RepID=A0A8J4UMM6_CLAMG|nr:Uncharacterized protein DAT39_004524 [Clarias magur]
MADVQTSRFLCRMERKELGEELNGVWRAVSTCVSGLTRRSSGVGHSTSDPLKAQVSCRQRNSSRHPDSIRLSSTHPSYTHRLQHPTRHQPGTEELSSNSRLRRASARTGKCNQCVRGIESSQHSASTLLLTSASA